MKPRFPVATLAMGSLLALMPSGCGEGDPQPITVMTRNLFLGAELTPLAGALTVADMASLAGGVWRDIQASRFPERADALADEIVRMDPDVVALQEVSLYRSQTPGDWTSDAAPNAATVELDFLQLLLDAISHRGASGYQFAVVGENADEELPATALDGSSFDIRLTDRDAILVKDGITFSSGPVMAFPTGFSLPIGGTGGATLVFKRGFVSADVGRGGKSVRVVNSHLEVGGALGRLQEQQAHELLAALTPMHRPMILAGDFNSPADGTGTASYGLLTTAAGSPSPFRDTWLFRQNLPGSNLLEFTCCMGIMDPTSSPQERIDLILFRGALMPVDVTVIEPVKTLSGLWGSDHLGVFAQMQIK